MTHTVGSLVGGYRIKEVLDTSGKGAVYRGRHPRLPRHDAIKVVTAELADDPGLRTRFQRAADLAAVLDHPAILKVYDRGEDEGRLWMSMRLVPGPDANRLSQERPGGLSLAEVSAFTAAIGAALDHVHAHGILHLDVRPRRILVDCSETSPRYLLGNFGIARREQDPRLSPRGAALGAVDHCAPEQLNGQTLGPYSDQYALAATALHLLTGQRPFGHQRHLADRDAQASRAVPRPSAQRPGLPAAIDTVFARALAIAPADRFPDCRALATALATAVAQSAAPAHRTTERFQTRRRLPAPHHAPPQSWSHTPTRPNSPRLENR